MESLKLVYEWLKKNWLTISIVLVIGALLWQSFANKSLVNSLMQENKAQFERQTANLQALQETHTQEIAAQQEINRQLQENLTRVENEYTTRLSDIEDRLRTRRSTTVRETEGNPEEMARRLRERLGWGNGTP